MLHPCCNFSSTAGLGDGEGNAACILRGANRFVTTLTNAFRHGFYMHLLPALGFGSVGPCWAFTWRFGHAQTASSQPSRMRFGTDSKCIWSRALGFGSMGPRWAFTRRFAQTASSQPSRMHFGTDSKCIRSPCSGLGSVRPCWAFTRRFGHAQTPSSEPSRMQFGTDSKCIRSPCSGLGV